MRNPEDQPGFAHMALRQLPEVRSNPIIPSDAREHSTYSHEDKALFAMREEIDRLKQENNSLRRKFDTETDSHIPVLEREDSQSSNVFTDNGDKKTVLNNKYNKALREITKLLKSNRQLRTELNTLRGREGSQSLNTPRYSALEQECDDLRFKYQALEGQAKELESTNNLYLGQLTEYENQVQEIKLHYEQQIRKIMAEYEGRIVELRTKFEKIEEEMGQPNQQVFDLKVSLERYKKQQAVWNEEKRSFYDQILRLQNGVEQARLDKQKLQDQLNVQSEKLSTKFRRELQEQIFEYKSENNNLRQSLQMISMENDRLNRQLKFSLSTKAQKHNDQSKVIWELNCQIETFISEIGGLRGAIEDKERVQAEMEILKNDYSSVSHNYQVLLASNNHLQRCLAEKEQQLHARNQHTAKTPVSSLIEAELKQNIRHKHSTNGELESLRSEVQHLRGENHLLYREIEEYQHKAKEQGVLQNQQSPELIEPPNPKIMFLQSKLKEFKIHIDLVNNLKFKEHDLQKEAGMMKIILSEISSSLAILVSDNTRMRTKLQRYRQKVAVYKQKLGFSGKDNKKLLEKIRSYDQLVLKYEKELENTLRKEGIKIDKGVKEKKVFRLSDLEEKLEIQGKGFEQELQTKVLEYEAKLLQRKLEVERLKEQANSFELYKSKIKEMADKIIELESLNSQYWTRINRAPLEHSRSSAPSSQNSEMIALIERLTEKDNKIITLEFKVSRLTDLLSHADNRNKDLELSIESSVEDYNQLRGKLTEVQMSNDNLRQQLSLCEIKLRNMENLKSMRMSLTDSDTRPTPREAQIGQLKVMLKKLTQTNQYLEYELSGVKKAASQRQEQLRRLQQEGNALKSKLDEANYRIDKFKKEQIELNTQLSSEKQNSEHKEVHYRANISDMKSRIEAAESELTRLREAENQLLTKNYEVTGLKTQCTRLQDKILLLESQLMHFNDLASKQTTQVQRNYEKDFELEIELHSLRQSKERHQKIEQNMANELNETNRNFAQQRKMLLEEINGLRSELLKVESLKRQLQYHVQGSSSSQTAKLNQALQHNNRLDEQIQGLKKRISELECEKKSDSEKVAKLESDRYKLAQVALELERVHQHLASRQEQLKLAAQRLSEAQAVIHQLENDLYLQKESSAGAQQLQQKYKYLHAETERLTKLKEELERDLRELRLRYTGDNYHQQRLKENLGLFVLLFVEIESLRGQLKSKHAELESSRRSSIAMAARPFEETYGGASPFHQHRISEPYTTGSDSPSKLQEISTFATFGLQPVPQISFTSESRILSGEPVGLEFRKSRSRSRNNKTPQRR